MPSKTLQTALDRLDEVKTNFDGDARRRLEKLLSQLARRRFTDAASLIRFHEMLLFLRAYPRSPALMQMTEDLLATIHQRVESLYEAGAEDFWHFSQIEFSGIAGTELSVNWGYEMARHIAAHHAPEADIDWASFENEAILVTLLKSLLPLFGDGGYVEYPIPFLEYIHAAKPQNQSDFVWLIERFGQMWRFQGELVALFDGLKLPIHWRLGNTDATRTMMRLPVAKIFYHEEPLIKRNAVSLAQEVETGEPLSITKFNRLDGKAFLRKGRDAMTVRLRELHGFNYGNASTVFRAHAGRGVDFYFWGVEPERRLPLLGYHAVMTVKNGVPIGYAESLSLFDRTEFGFNLFYSFRDGESAWLYARLLHLFKQHLGLTVFSVDPYQIGFHNEEAVEAGAFWFYRKLGFRPVRRDLAKLVEREEEKIATRKGYRTPKRLLRKLATGHLLYEAPTAKHPGEWDNFHLRHLGLAGQRRTAEQFDGDEQKHMKGAAASVARSLKIKLETWDIRERVVFFKMAPALALITDLPRWSKEEKAALVQIIRAKASADESRYVRLMQNHARLRQAIIRIGSAEFSLQ